MSLATQAAVKQAIERVKREGVSWYRAAKDAGVSLSTIYLVKRKLKERGKNK